jgi:SAM-dependent methyltransferase
LYNGNESKRKTILRFLLIFVPVSKYCYMPGYLSSLKNLDLCNKKVQFAIGFIAGILYFVILALSSHTSFVNIQAPEGAYTGNLWQCTDVITYYIPAKNFLHNGIFGYGDIPDSARPLGYQLFLALFIAVFGGKWVYAVYIVQSVLLALIYPVTTALIEEVVPDNRRLIKYSFLVSLFSGIYFVRAVYIGPDVMMVFLMISGIWLTIKSIRSQKWLYAVLSFLIIGYGAQVRPTLILYPLINLLIIVWAGMRFKTLRTRFVKTLIVVSSIFFIVVCNLPSLRNWINYRVFKPTIILSGNYYDYLAKKILVRENLSGYFYKTKAEIESDKDIASQLIKKKEKAKEVIMKYPFTTIKVIFYDNLKGVMLNDHLVNFTANFYGYNWKPVKAGEGCYSLKGSRFIYFISIGMAFLYSLLYLMFIISIIQLWYQKKYLFSLMVLFIIFIFLAPSIIIGDGGARFRIPFEWLIVIVACRTDLSFIKEQSDGDLDAPERTIHHRATILRKPFLRKIYVNWYRMLLEKTADSPAPKILEIGSGGGFIKKLNPDVITSDILEGVDCDMTFSADSLPFEESSLDAILMIDVLHHLPDAGKFFSESQRVLKAGGKIIMIEPANTLFSRFIYRNIHHENFDPGSKEWAFESTGPLSGANGALPWIIFKRDYQIFKTRFPDLSLVSIDYHTPFAYLVSGGLSYKSLLPGWLYRPFRAFELLLSPLNRYIGMFQTITVKKEKKDGDTDQ